MLQLLPRRQVSHNEPQCDRVVLRERKTSDGALEREYSNGTVTLERKTRHGSVISIESTHSDAQPEAAEVKKSLLIEELRKEIRHLMDESANGRSVYIHSSPVTTLCHAVENCLLDGLKRRLLGLFGGRSTFALLHSLSKHCAAGATVLDLTQAKTEMSASQTGTDVLWIRIALQEKLLSIIMDFIKSSHHCRRFYEKDALIVDPVKGGMIAAMMVGPCSIDYSMLRTVENGWSDPTADELVQRHRIHSSASIPSPKRPSLSVMRRGNSIVRSTDTTAPPVAVSRDYVSSLHQNIRTSLLYGKNNVGVILTPDMATPMKGYLSLHQANTGALTIKWTPNQLMHSSSQPSSAASPSLRKCDNHFLWRHAINLPVADIIYIHLHQSAASEDAVVCVVFVDTDGVQHPPLHFPPGQHALTFLSCLETGLQPFCVLDPPLWFHREKGKIFPRLKRRTSIQSTSSTSSFDGDSLSSGSEIHDYVFRIITVTKPPMERQEPMMEDFVDEEPEEPMSPKHCTSLPITPHPLKKDGGSNVVDMLVRNNLINACHSMRKQIASRAFLGWLAYCRHMRTVRTHLSCLVGSKPIDASSAPGQVDSVFWERCRAHRTPEQEREFFYRTYLYGIQDDLRVKCWPYLLGFARWSEDVDEKLVECRFQYEQEVKDWVKLEVIVRQRDKEAFKAARQRQMSTNGDLTYPLRVSSIQNEVFEEEGSEEVTPRENGTTDHARKLDSVEEQMDMVSLFGTNLHRIEKDVDRCDRNTPYFKKDVNLEKLKRVICTFVWRHMDEGYVQGMCDLAAVLLVIFDNEVLTLECFERLMLRLRPNFPLGPGMDENLNNLRSLVQVMDPELFDLMMSHGDFTHLYFSYRWFLLDFKRELVYENVYKVWEVIWASSLTVSAHFHLFFALALLSSYRNILLENSMDFTDVIKFFNEMAERHNAVELLDLAREQLRSLQNLVNDLK